MKIAKCESCGYIWEKRVKNPRQCPRCKVPIWDKIRVKKGNEGYAGQNSA